MGRARGLTWGHVGYRLAEHMIGPAGARDVADGAAFPRMPTVDGAAPFDWNPAFERALDALIDGPEDREAPRAALVVSKRHLGDRLPSRCRSAGYGVQDSENHERCTRMSEERHGGPRDPNTDEASPAQLAAAWSQGEAYGRAVALMTREVAHDGGEQQAGDYLIGYAIEHAEGMYEWVDGGLVWRNPEAHNVHVEITVRDASDGRFVPGLRVVATLVDPSGREVGTHEQPMLWHPMLYHYGRNWTVPTDGRYLLRVVVDPPRFSRHHEVNGLRFMQPASVEFSRVKVERGQG